MTRVHQTHRKDAETGGFVAVIEGPAGPELFDDYDRELSYVPALQTPGHIRRGREGRVLKIERRQLSGGSH